MGLFRRRERDASRQDEPERAEDAPLSASGDVRIEGEASFPTGLVAEGNLTLASDARLHGSVRVAGSLTLEAGARVVGDATVAGDATLVEGARIEGHLACGRLRLVAEAPAPATEEAASEPASVAA